ncbi:MAG: CotS family spore coat protein [Oscillospiraceae bacterium]|nr:CotS family spore coat protein [Oscillospiraceae bacterium]
MDLENIVFEKYGIVPKSYEKIKNIYKIFDGNEFFILKTVNETHDRFLFIFEVFDHLNDNGFNSIPKIISTLDGLKYISIDHKDAYLSKFVEGRLCNYFNPIDLKMATENLANIHLSSRGFNSKFDFISNINNWFKWIPDFLNKIEQLKRFKELALKNNNKSEFEKIYLENVDKAINIGINACDKLISSEYINIMKEHVKYREFCHHDYANHNILIDNEKVYTIDFDYCILDTHLHDLASLILRCMKYGYWDVSKAYEVIDTYSKFIKIDYRELIVMCNFMEFPQSYWQIGLQYFIEKLPWQEEVFIKRLLRFLNDLDDKNEFINMLIKGDGL